MLKKLLLLYILLPLAGFSQNPQLAIEKAKMHYEKGEFLKSYEVLNTIKDKNTLENTNINLHKANLEDILNHNFFKTVKFTDSLNKVYIRTFVLKSQGIFNTKLNQYTVPPIYDSIANTGYDAKFIQVFKDKLTGVINAKTGKTIIPLGDYKIQRLRNYFTTVRNDVAEYLNDNDIKNVYDLNGNLLYENLNYFGELDSNFLTIRRKGSKFQVIDVKTKEIVIDNCDEVLSPSARIVENDSLYEATWLPFEKNNKKYLYKINGNRIEDTHKFDTYIGPYNNYYYFENAIAALINNKDNAANCPEIENRICYFSYYTIVKKGDKFGIFNVTKDKFYKEPVYDSISEIGNTFYKGKWINLLYGEEILMPPAKDSRFIIFKKNNLYGLYDVSGKILIPANYDEITEGYYNTFHLRKGDNWGFTGIQKNDQLVEPQFDIILVRNGFITGYKKRKKISFLPNGTITNAEVSNKKIDRNYINGDNIFSGESDSRLIFEKDGKYGLDDFANNEIVAPKYTNIRHCRNNTFFVSNDTLQGLIDENEKELIPVKYSNINLHDYSDLLFAKDDRGLQGIFNLKGEMLYPPKIQKLLGMSSDHQKNGSEYLYATELSHTITEQNNPANTRKFYKNSILKIKGDKIEKLKIETSTVDFLTNFLAFRNNGQIGFYNFKTGKIIESQFKDYIPDNNSYRRIFAKKDIYYDTAIDSLGTITALEHPFFEEKNGYFFYKEDNKTGVLNKDLKAANFKYPVLKSKIDMKYYDGSSEYKEKASEYFEFNTNVDSKKNGVISYDGKIIVQPEKYDITGLFYFEKNDVGYTYNSENGHGKRYDNELLKNHVVFLGINKHKDFNTVTLFSTGKGNIAEFKVNKEETWSYGSYTSTIILKNKDSVKVYDIKTKKIILNVKSNRFLEDMDSGFTVPDSGPKLNKYTKYDCAGQFILDTIRDGNTQYIGIFDENYIQIKNNKYGTVSSKRKPGIPFIYDHLKSINSKYFITKKDNLCGVVNAENQTIVDKKYQEIEWVEKENYSPHSFFYAFKIKENNNWGMIGLNSSKIIPTEFDSIELKDYYIHARKDSLLSIYDFTGKLYVKAVADYIQFGNYLTFRVYKNGKEIQTDKNGKQLDKNPNLSEEEELKVTHCKQKDGKYYLSKNDSVIHKTPINKFEIIEISRNILDKSLEYLLIQDENNLYGLYTKDMNEVLPFAYNEIIYSKNPSFYIVNKNNKYGVVNASNQILIPFEYDAIEYDYRRFFKCKKNKKEYTITPQNKMIYIK